MSPVKASFSCKVRISCGVRGWMIAATVVDSIGLRDKASASWWCFPDLYTMSKVYSCNCSDQRAKRLVGLRRDFNQQSEWWSVTTMKGRPYRYGRNFCTAQIIAKHSRSVVE